VFVANRQQLWHRALPALLAFAFIGVFTLQPAPEEAERVARLPWTCLFTCGDQALRDAVLNVILFVPLGLALRPLLPGRLALLLVALTTVSIEFTQYHWLLGRDPSLRDILTNTAGGGIGIWLAGSWRELLQPSPDRSSRFSLATLLGWLAMVGITGALVGPSMTPSLYWVQWAPELGQFDTWSGEVLGAMMNGVPLPSGRSNRTNQLRAQLLSDSVMVEALIVSGEPPGKLAPIVSMFDSYQREIFVLGQHRRTLAFGIRTGLRAIGLGDIYVRLDAFPGGEPGDTALVSGGVVHGEWVLRAAHGPEVAETRIPMSPGLMWGALLPFFFVLGPATPYFSAAWLAGTIAPAGYFAARCREPGRRLAIAAGVAALGLTLAGLVPGLGFPPATEYLGTLAGLAAGWGIARWVG
jgi:hypothetical protein